MNKDFSFDQYELLLKTAIKQGYHCIGVSESISDNHNKVLIIRHDVDRKPSKSLKMAKIEQILFCRATYYFRAKPVSFDEDVIHGISSLNHEIGFHYENLCDTNGDIVKAFSNFKENLSSFTNLGYKINSIAMHGRPASPYDSKDIWKKYDYKKLGISNETFFDFDYNKILYVTDAGRAWSNDSVNKRDRVESKLNFKIDSLSMFIKELNQGSLPNTIMINIHPEHWAENVLEWYIIHVKRTLRNIVKKTLLRLKLI